MRSNAKVDVLACAFAGIAAVIAYAFHTAAPEPYMDEIFHVPQTQRYCVGQWSSWDPKITTFPGLYLLGAAAGRAAYSARRILAPHASLQLCAATELRALNVVLATAAVPLFWHLAAALEPSRSETHLTLMTAACALFPLHFFYTFLYYTDVASTVFTLAAWLAAAKQRYLLAGCLGAAAVGTRQTNAVWVAFIMAWAALDICLPGAEAANNGTKHGSVRQPCRTAAVINGAGESRGKDGAFSEVGLVAQHAWVLRRQLVCQLWPMAAVVAAFVAFVLRNGGIVVGDKVHHAPVQHLMQPMYCALYCTLGLAPVFWTPPALLTAAKALWRRMQRSPVATTAGAACAGAVCTAAVLRGTLVHPFLLADNRHYTFYVWRRVVNATPWARYALIPAYVYSAAALWSDLAHRHPLRAVLLAGATCVALVPAHLVELRYFTLPFLAAFLLLRTPSQRQLVAVVAAFAAVNAATLWEFLFRPFEWGDGSEGRFLW